MKIMTISWALTIGLILDVAVQASNDLLLDNLTVNSGVINMNNTVTRMGMNTSGGFWAIAIGAMASGDNVGTAMGVCSLATNWGAAVGYRTDGSSYGVAMGCLAYAPGLGNVAIGGTPYISVPPTNPTNGAAMVPSNFVDTVELGRGTATLQGGLNFRGHGIANSNGVVVASINTTNLLMSSTAIISNLTVSGSIYIPKLGDLSMGSFTNRPGL
jgi:hypothetical protein